MGRTLRVVYSCFPLSQLSRCSQLTVFLVVHGYARAPCFISELVLRGMCVGH